MKKKRINRDISPDRLPKEYEEELKKKAARHRAGEKVDVLYQQTMEELGYPSNNE